MPSPKPTISLRRPSLPPLHVVEAFVGGAPTSAVDGPAEPTAMAAPAPLPIAEAASEVPPVAAPERMPSPPPPYATRNANEITHTARPGLVQRRSGRVRRRTTVYLEPALAKKLTLYCAAHEIELSAVAEEAIRRFLPAE